MAWLADTLRENPEVAVFLVLALGAAIGQVRWRSFQLGTPLGCLLAGLVIGQLRIAGPAGMKDVFFLLFLFAVGLRTGAEFFRSLRSSAVPQLALTCLLVVTGFALVWGFTRAWGLDGGTSAGLFAGAMTNSTALGTATDAATMLPLDSAARQQLANNVATTYALTYLLGLLLTVWFLPTMGPRLMRVNLKDVSREYEQSLGVSTSKPSTAYRPIVVRGYRLPDAFDGLTVAEVEHRWPPEYRAIVARVRRGDQLFDALPATRLRGGDVVAVAGRSDALIGDPNPLQHDELHDRGLLEIPTVSADLVLTNRALAGRTLQGIVDRLGARGIFLLTLRRAGRELPFSASTIIERGDVLSVSGSRAEVARVAAEIGYAEYATTSTDVLLFAATITIGALIGIPALTISGFTISLTSPVGVLLAGLTLGHLRASQPRFGRIPQASAALFETLGLSGFLALVGLQAGPAAIAAIRASGPALLAAGAVVTLGPHIVTILIGYYLVGLHPAILLGLCAGAGTSTPSLAELERAAESRVPTIGYGMACAVGNVLTAIGGTVLVMTAG
jgi:putative transport protein